ncbi:MAG: hypothetical protein EXS52_00705 [Candidatus Staskawiczbacteria bacterium]|nr:hypothetical protein [Candidatus Staskawiczbacteria bacterium]
MKSKTNLFTDFAGLRELALAVNRKRCVMNNGVVVLVVYLAVLTIVVIRNKSEEVKYGEPVSILKLPQDVVFETHGKPVEMETKTK